MEARCINIRTKERRTSEVSWHKLELVGTTPSRHDVIQIEMQRMQHERIRNGSATVLLRLVGVQAVGTQVAIQKHVDEAYSTFQRRGGGLTSDISWAEV